MDYDAEGNPRVHYPGDYNILVPGPSRHRLSAKACSTKHGVDTQVITFTTPGTHVEAPATARRRWPGTSTTRSRDRGEARRSVPALATLPLNDPAASVAELERAMRTLGLPGAMVFSNVNGVALADERFGPLWKKAERARRGHATSIPTDPVGVEAMDGVLADAARRAS